MSLRRRLVWAGVFAVAAACGAAACGAGSKLEDDDGEGKNGPGAGSGGSGGGFGAGVGGSTSGGDMCKVAEVSGDALPPCEDSAPPDSFDPEVQWEWTAPEIGTGYNGSIVSALVGNFNDDNNDGAVDLCDMPEVLVTAADVSLAPGSEGTIYMLRGDTGEEQRAFHGVDANITPAFADIDNDELPELVAVGVGGALIAFENDGTPKWTGQTGYWTNIASYCTALAIYDLDFDGSAEIIGAFDVFDAQGQRLWGITPSSTSYWCPAPSAADLDGDGDLEVLFGNAAYHHDGTPMWTLATNPGHAHVGNLDSDDDPEIVLTTGDGIYLVQHTGTITWGPLRPTGGAASPNCWGKPGVIHDFDGDGPADFATGSCTDYSVYTISATGAVPKWTAAVQDNSGLATGTAFDFLGDTVADAIYSDETNAYVFDGASGENELTVPRTSGTLIEFPVVADIDNDGSAEIVIVSNSWGGLVTTVTVIRDAQDRWIQARRIWNQHAYHVTNIREDGRLPTVKRDNWKLFNTFRANSQIEDGDCQPQTPR
jgi:hypothetical protein